MTNYTIDNENQEAKASPSLHSSPIQTDRSKDKNTSYKKEDNATSMKKSEETKMPDTMNLQEEPNLPDGGWGWMVAIGCFLIMSLIPMVGPCFGILFSRFLLDLGTSSTTTAWIFNSQCFIWNIMGLITRPLTQEFGWRKIGMLGALLTSISIITSAFAPSAEFLFFSFSLLSGTGGAVTCICFTILPNFFDKHRGVANAMMMAGVCLGQIVAPPLLQFLQDEFGFQGATMIVGAIMLNGCVGASFFHPVAWHWTKSKKYKSHSIPEAKTSLLSANYFSKQEKGAGFRTSRSVASLSGLKESYSTKSVGDAAGREADWVEIVTHARRQRQGRRISDLSWASVSSSLTIATMDLAGVGAGYAEKENSEASSSNIKKEDGRSLCNIVSRVVKSTISDLRVLRSPRALIIAVGATFTINGYINFIMMVPFSMQVAGYSLEYSAWCISFSAICNLMMRMLVSGLSDWPRFNVKACYVAGFAVIFISTLVFPFFTDQRWMLVVIGVWGCGVGANMGVYNLVMITVMGLDNLAPVFGASCFMVAMGFITFGPLIGVVRDASESYAISVWMVSAMTLGSLILWLFIPWAQAYDKRRVQAKEEGKAQLEHT